MPNVNIPQTEMIKLVWAHQEKRISRKMMNMVVPGKRRMGRGRQLPGRYEKCELTADMTGDR